MDGELSTNTGYRHTLSGALSMSYQVPGSSPASSSPSGSSPLRAQPPPPAVARSAVPSTTVPPRSEEDPSQLPPLRVERKSMGFVKGVEGMHVATKLEGTDVRPGDAMDVEEGK